MALHSIYSIMYCKYYVKKKRKIKRRYKVLAVLAIVVVVVLVYYAINVSPIIKRVSEEEMTALSMLSLNTAANEAVTDAYTYDDLVEVVTNSEGSVTLITANVMVINILARTVAERSQYYLDLLGEQVISIPWGTMSGLTVLSGLGPMLELTVLPVGSVVTEIDSSFTSAGINQTLHQLTLNVTADMDIILPGLNSKISVTVPIIIAENVIVGEIPDTYLNSDDLDNMLNLVA